MTQGTPGIRCADQRHLEMVDARLNGLRINDPTNHEVARLEAARQDIISRIGARDGQ